MLNGNLKGVKPQARMMGIAGIQEVNHIDQIIEMHRQLGVDARIPTRLVIDVMRKELASREFKACLKKMPMQPPASIGLRELHSLIQAVPCRLYFFLWNLKNTQAMPLDGVLNSRDLKHAVAALNRYLNVLEGFLKRSPSIQLLEHLGFTYFDLAGIAQYARKGIPINGRLVNHSVLLRKAIASFQCAIRFGAQQARELDSMHKDILKLVDDQYDLKENRTNLYLNPWHFLYISSALHLLNDEQMSKLYLQKSRLILNNIEAHQDARIVAQKELLESIYTTIHFGKSIKFDFGEANLLKLKKKLKAVRKQRVKGEKRGAYSPLVENALAEEFQVQCELRKGGLRSEQRLYLNGVYALYQQEISPLERDKLIFRLNIPPVKIHGLQRPSGPSQRKAVGAPQKNVRPLKLAAKSQRAA